MKVKVWPADKAGCGHYRILFPARALQAQGADVEIDHVGPVIEWSEPWEGQPIPPPSCHVVNVRPYEADVVVMQRVVRQHFVELIPHLQRQGIRVVIDVDDLLDSIDRRNIAYKGHQPGRDAVSHTFLDLATAMADAVTVTTPALLKRYGGACGSILPNLVPEDYLSIFGLKRPNTVGWAGVIGTHPGDLRVTEGAVPLAMPDEWSVHVVGDGIGVGEELGLHQPKVQSTEEQRRAFRKQFHQELPEWLPDPDFGGRLTRTGYLPFDEYAPAVAELELGIVPLVHNEFNGAKSALKASEMAAVGVPVVMSPTPDNLRLNRLGVGVVAESRSQWLRTLKHLMHNDSARYELAEQGRAVMESQTYERHADRWWDAWTGGKPMVAAA